MGHPIPVSAQVYWHKHRVCPRGREQWSHLASSRFVLRRACGESLLLIARLHRDTSGCSIHRIITGLFARGANRPVLLLFPKPCVHCHPTIRTDAARLDSSCPPYQKSGFPHQPRPFVHPTYHSQLSLALIAQTMRNIRYTLDFSTPIAMLMAVYVNR